VQPGSRRSGSARSGKSLRQIIRDTRRVDFYLDAWKAKEYGLIDEVIGAAEKPATDETLKADEEAETAESAPGASPPPSAPPLPELTINGRAGR